jgi:biopolymer transport protein ExbB
MTGFLGTVVGMIQAFHKMATAGGQIEVGALSEGIYRYDNYRCWTCCGYIAYGYNH